MNHLRASWASRISQGAGDPARSTWADLETGKAATVYCWRGTGVYGGLTEEQQAKFGREFLLGPGVYAAPTERGAEAFGIPSPVKVVLRRPYVLTRANVESLRKLDPSTIEAQGHDAIVIKSGQAGFGRGQEDLKQVCVFPAHAGQVTKVDTIPKAEGIWEKGVKVRIIKDHDYATHPSWEGREGVIVSTIPAIKAVNVKVKGEPKARPYTYIQLEFV